jgi:hypothetical protein
VVTVVPNDTKATPATVAKAASNSNRATRRAEKAAASRQAPVAAPAKA